MIKLFLIITIFILSLSANIVDDIGKKLDMIKQESINKSKDIDKIAYDPFHKEVKPEVVKVEKKDKERAKKIKSKGKKLELLMIFNKKAFINGKWYKEKMRVADYVLRRVNEDSVILSKKNKIITLNLNSKKLFFKRGIR